MSLVFDVAVEPLEIDVEVQEPVVAALLVTGPPGPQGPPGTGSFIHTQATAAATWSVTHDLGRVPNSCLIVVGGELVHTDVVFPSSSTVNVTFASPQAGTLRLT